jgi:hypothetical protein
MDRLARLILRTLGGWTKRRVAHVRSVDGSEVTLIGEGDAFEFLYLPRGVAPRPYACPVEARQARGMLGVLARWWVLDTWCGLRLRLWDWALARRAAGLRGADRG